MRMSLLGGASAYAHLAGLIPTRGGRRAEEEDKDDKTGAKSRRAEDDEDDDEPKGKKSRAEDDPEQYPDENDDQPKGKKKSRRAEDDEDDERAEDDDDEPKGKKSRRAEEDEDDKDAEDDDDKEEMSGKSAAARARGRERARCKAIFSHPVAAQNVALAASLAFDTTMTRKEAIAVLKGQTGRGGDQRDDRSARRARGNADLGPSAESKPSGAKALAASWDRALATAGVKPRGQ